MQAGLAVLCLAYVLSQFFRAFLAVLSQVLAADVGAGADDLAFASGLWFLSFAAMQLPVGWAASALRPNGSNLWPVLSVTARLPNMNSTLTTTMASPASVSS